MNRLYALTLWAMTLNCFAQAPPSPPPWDEFARKSGSDEVTPPRRPIGESPETAARQVPPPGSEDTGTPWILRWMLKDVPRGMLVRLPIIDTDPNRGTTIGFMPIWIFKEPGTTRIERIHAPSITYNRVFGPIPTYRYYFYPTDESALLARLAGSTQIEREAMAAFEDENLGGKDIKFYVKFQYNIDGARRFYGLGPNSPKSGETNYAEDYIQYDLSLGVPFWPSSNWKIHGYNHVQAWRTWNGKTPNLAPFKDVYPGVGPSRRQQTNIVGTKVTYDSRDHGVTTSKGAYLDVRAETSKRGFASAHDFQRYGADARWYYKPENEPDHTYAFQVKFDQQLANAPFWLQSNLGGKYSLRAYGDGRYVDRGSMSVNYEHRVTLWKIPLAGVTTEFEVAPFMGAGTVFDNPGRLAKRYMRPVFGIATRAVARPQVVGSIDFGYGQEGLAAFIDINYAF